MNYSEAFSLRCNAPNCVALRSLTSSIKAGASEVKQKKIGARSATIRIRDDSKRKK